MSILSELISPNSEDSFFQDYFEKEHLYLPKVFGASQSQDLFSVAELERIIGSHNLDSGTVRVSRADELIDRSTFTFDNGFIDPIRALAHVDAGASLILNQAHTWSHPLAVLCRKLEKYFLCRTQVNAYFSPPESQGFPAHWDSHDVFIIQVHGSKLWDIHDVAYYLPDGTRSFDRDRYDPGPVRATLRMECGDVLYIPRGMMHRVRTDENSSSLHLTVGLLTVTIRHIMVRALDLAFDRVAALRRSPRIVAGGGDTDIEATMAQLKEALPGAFAEATLAEAIVDAERDIKATGRPVIDGAFDRIMRLSDTTEESWFRGNPLAMPIVRQDDDGGVAVMVHGEDMELEGMTADDVRQILGPDWQQVRDLPTSVAAEDRISLIRQFVLRGLVELQHT